MKKGNVKFYDAQKGYGFVTTATGEYFFCHAGVGGKGIYRPEKGDKVMFTVSKTDRGPRAESIEKLAINKDNQS